MLNWDAILSYNTVMLLLGSHTHILYHSHWISCVRDRQNLGLRRMLLCGSGVMPQLGLCCSGVTVCHRWGFVQQWLCYCVTYRELTELEKIVSLLRLRPHIDAVSMLSHSEDQVWFLCILYTGLLVLLSENCLCGKVELDRQTDRAVLGEGSDCRTVCVARSSLTDRQSSARRRIGL